MREFFIRRVLSRLAKMDDKFPPHFMIANWYSFYKNHTIETDFFDIPIEFLAYLYDENFIHPRDYFKNEMIEITRFKSDINHCIKKYSGNVFIKLLWSSPKDSGWLMLNGKAIASSFDDICLMLKNSDRLHEVIKAIKASQKFPSLAVRKFIEIDYSMEFRCIVKDLTLIACCQRDLSTFYPSLYDQKDTIISSLTKFLTDHFFPVWKHDTSFILDIFINSDNEICIIDIGPFDNTFVDPLLFEWAELDSHDKISKPLFRIIPGPDYTYRDKEISNGFPIEFADQNFTSNGELVNQLLNLMNISTP